MKGVVCVVGEGASSGFWETELVVNRIRTTNQMGFKRNTVVGNSE